MFRARTIAAACVVVLGVALDAPAHAGVVVSMGDSYSSGEASGPYDAGTDDGALPGGVNACHRSAQAWPRLLGVQTGYHLACSGATTENFTVPQRRCAAVGRPCVTYRAPDHVGQLQRLKELQSTAAVDRVFITIGGNDLGFSSIVKDCRFKPRGCLRRYTDVELPRMRKEVKPAVVKALQAVTGAVPSSAQVVLVGYPDVLPQDGEPFTRCGWLTDEEKLRLRKLQTDLDETLNAAAGEAGVGYIPVREALRGHELCTKDSWVKPITQARDRGVENQQQMAHPTAKGQQAIADLVRQRLEGASTTIVAPRPGCTRATSVAAIIDDSGSMEDTDPEDLRRRAMELLITKPGGDDRVLSGIQFGTWASSLFPPQPAGSGRDAMLASLGLLEDDEGQTDYDEAFRESAALHGAPGARLFLTDGAHNDGTFDETHRGGPRTYVIGLGIGADGSEAADRLQRIADETGGAYFPLVAGGSDDVASQARRLQPTFNTIDALLECRATPDHSTRSLTAAGRSAAPVLGRFLGAPSLDVVLSWGTPGADVDLVAATARGANGRIVADLRGPTTRHRKRLKLTVNTIEGATFDTITVARPRGAATLSLTVAAPTLPAPVDVTVQVRPTATVATSGTTTVPQPVAAPVTTQQPATTPQPGTTPPQTGSTPTPRSAGQVAVQLAGSGSVTSTPAGISCGSTCTASFATGSPVTLTAAPAAGWAFAGWSGACSGTGGCSVTPDAQAARSVKATFTALPPPTRQIVVDNRVTNGGTQMREDSPAYLSTVMQNFCKRDGCALAGTDMGSGAGITAECTGIGARTTNGQDGSSIDDGNPGLYSSTRWYGIRWGDGRFGFISEVWIRADFRGGLGLRTC